MDQQSFTRISDLPTGNAAQQNQSQNAIVFPPPVSISNTKVSKIDGDIPTNYMPINVHQNPYGIAEQNPIMEHGMEHGMEHQHPPNTQPMPVHIQEELSNMQHHRLPSRDINQDTTIYANDEQIQANYIPRPNQSNDYVRENEDMTEHNVREYNRKQKRFNTIDTILTELQTPLFITILFFIFQLPIINNLLFKQFTVLSLHNLDGNFNLTGLILKSIIFGIFYYLSFNIISVISEI